MSYEVKGIISKILPIETGVAKSTGNAWKKVEFIVSNNEGFEGREKIYCFQMFSEKSVDNFIKYNQVGSQVLVKFEVNTNEHNGKYYTSLSAYRVESGERVEQAHQTPQPPKQQGPIQSNVSLDELGEDDLPF